MVNPALTTASISKLFKTFLEGCIFGRSWSRSRKLRSRLHPCLFRQGDVLEYIGQEMRVRAERIGVIRLFSQRKRSIISLLTIAVGVHAVVGLLILLFKKSNKTTSTVCGNIISLMAKEDNETSMLCNMIPDDGSAAEKATRKVGNLVCFFEGLDERTQVRLTAGRCPCKTDWFGAACSIPGFINRSPTPWSKDSLQLRSQPRRIIHAFPFTIEFDMLEMRFAELVGVVDVFFILESNYTAFGSAKSLRLLEQIRNGTYPIVAGKVVHIFLNYFPSGAHRDGWIADALFRNYLGTNGLRRLGGLKPDDLLVLTDADELPRRQVLSFLKWHDGYSEPVNLVYQWSVYGFFWGFPDAGGAIKTHNIPSVVTVAMAVYVFRYKIYFIRSASNFIRQHQFDVQVETSLIVTPRSVKLT